MRTAVSYLLLFVALILQSTLGQACTIFGVAPNLVLTLAVCLCLTGEPLWSAVFGLVAGLLLDISGGQIVGFEAILMLYLGLGASLFGNYCFRGNVHVTAITVFGATFIYQTVFVLAGLFLFGNGSFGAALRTIFLESFYNAAVAVPCHYLIKRVRGYRMRDF
ncbi:MAG: rod shape-determining protein MreD [Ruminococcaceae bacterium]|nr:rod shape-determining protein MreD [Oscillospiraceae bacterium]